MSRADELADRIAAVSDELDELMMDELQQALADGATSRPASDRTLTQARRALEKAERLLRQLETGGPGSGGADDGSPA